MKCPKHKTEMRYIDYFARGVYPQIDSVNYYCEKCNIIYFKFIKDDVEIKED
jgi:hypothetical protein